MVPARARGYNTPGAHKGGEENDPTVVVGIRRVHSAVAIRVAALMISSETGVFIGYNALKQSHGVVINATLYTLEEILGYRRITSDKPFVDDATP